MSHTEQKAKDREIIDNSDIVKVVDKFVPLKKKGREHVGVCPFHDDKHASLSVNGKMQIFKCFACGEGGDVIDFLMKMGARTFRDAVNELNGMDSIVVDPAQREAYQKEGPKWKAIVPAPEGAKSPDFNHFKHGH
ncbi:MAG: CHC2 zinc finger domain-containing protein, partial [Endozoicomonas sp.]